MPAALSGCYWTQAGNYVFGADDHGPTVLHQRRPPVRLNEGGFGRRCWGEFVRPRSLFSRQRANEFAPTGVPA